MRDVISHKSFYIAVLLITAILIGVYLIGTTYLISKDGVLYLTRAKIFAESPAVILAGKRPPAYSTLIFLVHSLIGVIGNTDSPYTWIYSGQIVTFISRLVAIFVLFHIGKLLVGTKKSFIACLILVFLPYPAKMGADVLREWPHLLLLCSGYYCLIKSIRHDKLLLFFLAGLFAGIGYLIRPMCIQVTIYGVVLLGIKFLSEHETSKKAKAMVGMCALLIGSGIFILPYVMVSGEYLPNRAQTFIKTVSAPKPAIQANSNNNIKAKPKHTEISARNILSATNKLFERIGENLSWFFLPAFFVGLYIYFKNNINSKESLLLGLFIIFNIFILIMRYCTYSQDISRRYVLPLIALTIFYVPDGLLAIARQLENKLTKTRITDAEMTFSNKYFLVLLIAGLAICLPKLLTPMNIDKQHYIQAAEWLQENTMKADLIYVEDKRISFYAGREGETTTRDDVKYAVIKLKSDKGEIPDDLAKWQKLKQIDSPEGYSLIIYRDEEIIQP